MGEQVKSIRGNGHGHDGRLALRSADGLGQVHAGPPQLGEIVRDAMDHAHVIARDAMAIGRLEAERAVGKAKHEAIDAMARVKVEATDVLPRVAFGAAAVCVGTVGSVFAFLAAFLGLGYAIPSLAARFAIFGGLFLLGACAFAAMAARKRSVQAPPRHLPPRHADALRHIAPFHPLDGMGI